MATRNYRQAKRAREETRKKRKQEKLERKQSRGTEPLPGTDADAVTPAADEPKDPA
jgi:hypothetical protein